MSNIVILTSRKYPRGYCRTADGGRAPIYALVALDRKTVGLLRLSLRDYQSVFDALQGVPPERWSFRVTCDEYNPVGNIKALRVMSIKQDVAPLAESLSRSVVEAFSRLT